MQQQTVSTFIAVYFDRVFITFIVLTAAGLAQSVERLTAEREVESRGRTTQGLQITEK